MIQKTGKHGESRMIRRPACRTNPGNAQDLKSAMFEPYNPGGAAPHQSPLYGAYGVTPDLLRLGLKNPQLRFFQEPPGTLEGPDPLVDVLQEWLGKEKPVSVLDFSGVPAAAADLAIGVILNLLFEVLCAARRAGRASAEPVRYSSYLRRHTDISVRARALLRAALRTKSPGKVGNTESGSCS